MEHLLTNLFTLPYLDIVKSVIATASLIAAITPAKYDDMALNFLRQTVDLMALNFGNARNAKR